MTCVGGYVMGLGFGVFMNAMEYRQIETHKGVRAATRDALRTDVRKIKRTARGFAVFGGLFSMFECLMEKYR